MQTITNPQGLSRILESQLAVFGDMVVDVGADCVFNQASHAPITTLFVKDKSLANNPIGALYSEYYLRESATYSREPFRSRAVAGAG